MINIEKLSLLNLDKFIQIYKPEYDSYLCDKNFFEIYNTGSFLIKYIIRKQVKLFKYNDEYIGYIWHEYSGNILCTTVYNIYIKSDFINFITADIFSNLKLGSCKIDIIRNNESERILNKLGFEILYKSLIMNLNLNRVNIDEFKVYDNVEFMHFKRNRDEELRCKIQNMIFKNNHREPLKVNDILEEENEEYFIEDFCVFLCDNKGQALGYGQIILNKGQYTIVNFGILEEHRQKGFGEELLRYLIELCKINSILDIYIHVEECNYKAVNLYTKVGFAVYDSCATWIKNYDNETY